MNPIATTNRDKCNCCLEDFTDENPRGLYGIHDQCLKIFATGLPQPIHPVHVVTPLLTRVLRSIELVGGMAARILLLIRR